MEPKIYNCPACGVPVEAKADYLARGLKCPSCNAGFIPEKIELRRKIKTVEQMPWWVPLAFIGVAACLFGFVPLWVSAPIAAVALLVAILAMARKL